ncbi:Holliday junction branch migration protein RuvA [Clavibacter tessellarius]|uniref:Holliday junction branch migration complex subunit RuvA n=1 Tax=Clavibacter tessellarius TaxID=31965 RepID=A0A225CRZ1_9MICO|nr:Holliday junction branch migration protein RuvA [Clavibacter michiganensis]OQJ64462.1 Holliday junction branch migration protein RuvA [Clavibacter michiganensis subsp. tessellarius]UKF33472.1 Holliday junction branch migration protein RuvA [Clavibacter michiganensis subsp. tessellarius]
MISSLRGTVLSVSGQTLLLEVHGVGYGVQVTPRHALELRHGSEATVLTSLVVREDSLTLFGFPGPDELRAFELLCGVTGVGPKSALAVLEHLDPEAMARAIAVEDDAAFRRVSGIGPKTAKLIVLQLAGKLVVTQARSRSAASAPSSVTADVLTALVGLGWSERVARTAVDDAVAAAEEQGASADMPRLLRVALGMLGPQQAPGAAAAGAAVDR